MRKPILAANWKMNKLPSEIDEYASTLLTELKDNGKDVDVVVIPPYTGIYSATESFKDTDVFVGAQNVYPKDKGAYTGEVSAPMLKDLSVKYVVVGHSERRMYFNESDDFINKKVLAVLDNNLVPILCVGETEEQKDKGTGKDIVLNQIKADLLNVSKDIAENIVIAYEPVWAIGTGKSATADDAADMITAIRATLKDIFGDEISDKIRIQYGGSVKPENIAEYMKCKDIDGALIGGAGLDPVSFAQIIKNIENI